MTSTVITWETLASGSSLPCTAISMAAWDWLQAKPVAAAKRSEKRMSPTLKAAKPMRRSSSRLSTGLAGEPAGQLTNVRFDVALVDHAGRFEIIENAFGQG